jgi:hypothetical protein
MDPFVLNDISRRIRNLDTRRLTGRVSRYIRLSASAYDALCQTDLNGERILDRLESCCWELFGEIPLLLDRISGVRDQLVDLRYKESGEKPLSAENRESARACFGAIKRHGMELLAHLTDEVGILHETLRQGEQVRRLVNDHTDPMKRSANLLDILLERFAHRPTVAYRVGGRTREVRQLAYAVEGMEQWTSATDPAEENGPAEALRVATLSPYGRIIRSMWEELEQRGRKIDEAAAELNQGWDLLHRLAAGGYSKKIRRQADTLSFKHRARRRAFKKVIREGRAGSPERRSAEGV